MDKARFISFASVISEIKQSDMFMTVKARILETPKANLNGCRVTEAFVDEVVGNEERYVGLPLYADIKALTSGKYNRLGHLYDSRTGEFHSTQIGSFYQFAKEEFDGGCYLVGYARIPKRNKALSKAIAELFAEEALKFSFEISCGDCEELEDGTIQIDVSENNYLEGTAIVTFPACEDAVALEFVAQQEAAEPAEADNTRGGETEMAENKVEAAEIAEEVVSEEIEVAEEAATEEEQTEEKVEEIAEETTEVASEEVSEDKETAAVVVREEHNETHSVHAYDPETGAEAHQSVNVFTETVERQEGQLVQADDGIHIAEDDAKDEDESGDDEDLPAPDSTSDGEKKKTAEELIAELAETVRNLSEEIASLKQARAEHIAASAVIAETPNPFVESIDTKGKYSLLESTFVNTKSLLDP